MSQESTVVAEKVQQQKIIDNDSIKYLTQGADVIKRATTELSIQSRNKVLIQIEQILKVLNGYGRHCQKEVPILQFRQSPSSIYSWSIQPLFLLHSNYEFD